VNPLSALSTRTQLSADFDRGPLQVIGTTLLSIAAVNYWAYDRFLLSYVLATQCAGCNAPAPAAGSEQLLVLAAAAGAYLSLLICSRPPLRRAAWGWGTLLIALVTTVFLARAHGQVVVGTSERWAAVNLPARLAVYCGAGLVLSTLGVAVLERPRRSFLNGPASIVVVVGTCLLSYGVSSWSRGTVTAPMAKAVLLLAGTEDTLTWWKRSLAALLTAATVLVALAARSNRRRRWSRWLWLAVGLAAVGATLPHALDLSHPLSLRDAVPTGLSRVSSCLANSLPEAVPLDGPARNAPLPAGAVGYLPASLSTEASELGPLLAGALTRGVHLVVVPAKRSRTVATHTLGILPYEEVCWAGQIRLSSTAEARRLADFATLDDLIRSAVAVDPTAAEHD